MSSIQTKIIIDQLHVFNSHFLTKLQSSRKIYLLNSKIKVYSWLCWSPCHMCVRSVLLWFVFELCISESPFLEVVQFNLFQVVQMQTTTVYCESSLRIFIFSSRPEMCSDNFLSSNVLRTPPTKIFPSSRPRKA